MWTAACRSAATWRHLRTDLSLLAAEEQYKDELEVMAHALRVLAKRLLPDLGRKPITAQLKSRPEAQDLVFLLSTFGDSDSLHAAVDPLQAVDPWHSGKGKAASEGQAQHCGSHVSSSQARHDATVQYITVEKFVEVPQIEYVEKIVEIPRIEYIEKEVIKEVEKLVEEIVEVPRIEYIDKGFAKGVEKLMEKIVEVRREATAQCGVEHEEAAVQVSTPRCITSDQDAADVISISDRSSRTGPWEPIREASSVQVGDFVKVAVDTKSMNPEIVLEKSLLGRVRKLDDDGHAYVFFPDAVFHCISMHWVQNRSLLLPDG